ncbi:pilus assembly protein [Pseudotabrizicola formosa]|uniref:pilus assembly protein n=1 Tax=Pseudotabrizicola formosa TaxID=2030009 RepID=UPI000CD10CBB|nr:pilus assembly protein [Pseudotabrizicola formosa]
MRSLSIPHSRRLIRFWTDETGAVTVDWVVLTVAVAGLALTIATLMTPQIFAAVGSTIVSFITEAQARP